MFGLFKRKPEKKHANFNYESIMVDMHSHVLPGIDDGAKTPQDSIVLIRKMMELGIKKIIATPHVMIDFYRNTPETINNALEILKAELVKENIDIPVEAAAEHYFDETFEARVNDGKLITMGDNYALFEFSFINQPPNAISVIQTMNDMGYKPILAHPERYPYMDIDQFKNLHNWGCNFQLNTISLTGYYGKEAKRLAESLIDNQLIDFISSDMHHPKHAAAFGDALRTIYIEKLLFDYPLKNTLLF
ncbi:CpsB/CapC family capsule biosynthesis tyrosine phosphatase [Mucilaginibacter sabulilitoris]|uniref:protein-tyrosine-phosphatase n=1 Tax=Mucilaginibacter sabulilitoris TaxID=1173583 RepID=A0ABZ0TL46_9SPHI|nr:CpsB/CapC family capsule biosynthesis tyrosine phosphatase [Mucilaginibacter sabulilitoris]WPU93899.1 CpsB/CapC family capsule biosynthesis tyrosine phosphatase [Mucilaginibacter sabulilitoris]